MKLKTIVAVGLALAAPSFTAAQEPHLAVVRVESLNALLADAERVTALFGQSMSKDELMGMMSGAIGGQDLSWVDPEKPLLVAASQQVMTMGPQGVLVALPVGDRDAALAALGAIFGELTPDENGVYTLPGSGEEGTTALFREGYFVASPIRDMALGFQPQRDTARGDLPPGSLVVDVFLEPLAPMALGALQAGRGMIEEQIEEESAAAGEGEEAAPEMDPEALSGILGLYMDVITDLIHNASRIQISIEVAPRDLIVHERVVPKAGSTLAGLVAAQKGGMPAVARLIEAPPEAFVVVAGQVTPTDALRQALKHYAKSYATAMEQLGASAFGAGGEDPMMPYLAAAMKDLDRWPDCYRGDFAGTFDIEPGKGFGGTQVWGMADPALCGTLLTEMLAAAADFPAGEDGVRRITAQASAFEYKGVTAHRYGVDFSNLPGMEEDEEARELFEKMFGTGMDSYSGLRGDLMLSAAGGDAEAAFKKLVDRAAAGPGAGGLTAARFAPMPEAPGMVAVLDFRRLAQLLPADEDVDLEKIVEVLESGDARLVYGLAADKGAMHIRLAVPTGLISAIVEQVSAGEEPTPAAPAEGEAAR